MEDAKGGFMSEDNKGFFTFWKTLTVQAVGLPSAAAAPDILVFFLAFKTPWLNISQNRQVGRCITVYMLGQ